MTVRVGTMMLARAVLAAFVTFAVAGHGSDRLDVMRCAYLAVTLALSLLALLPDRRLGVAAFGASLLLDGVFLQVQAEVYGPAVPMEAVIAVHLVVVCLLASFRSGLSLAIWQSLVMNVALRAEQAGLFPEPAWAGGIDRDRRLLAQFVLYWLAVLAACSAAMVSELELRRRRYDAEVLHRFAEDLMADELPEEVAARLCAFLADEVGATRVLIGRRGGPGAPLEVAAGRGLAELDASVAATPGSALLDLVAGQRDEVLVLRLDADRDPVLAGLLPSARRLVALGLRADEPGGRAGAPVQRFVVVEHAARRGTRVATRFVATVRQATAAASIALSRAELLASSKRAAATDGLTGLANRRMFDQRIAELVAEWRRDRRPFALVLVDVDHFKSVNDRLGHQAGDEVLQAVAASLASVARVNDMAARYGGEEFALLLPGTGRDEAVVVAERARVALHAIADPVAVTASFGVAAVPEDAGDVADVIWRADECLLHAKETGRNRVVAASPRAAAASPEPAAEPASGAMEGG